MTPERWNQINALFLEAVKLAPADRPVFLDQACAADPELRSEVERLLAADADEAEMTRTLPNLLGLASGLIHRTDIPTKTLPAGGAADALVGFTERGVANQGPSVESKAEFGPGPPGSLVDSVQEATGPPVIPGFTLVRRLGAGGFGQVWLARSATGVYRAVKLMPKGLLTEIEFSGVRTYDIHARGNAHLISILHVDETPDWLYYVMELADGYATAPTFRPDEYEPRTLASELRRRGHLGLAEAVSITLRILLGLRHLHERELLHRDVKPANIVFVEGVAKLADIGLLTEGHRRGLKCSTRPYAPPEGIIDRSGDLYCLGKTVYEMITGLPAQRFPEVPEDAGKEQLGATRALMPVLMRACAAKPEGRFHTTEEFQRALDRQLGQPTRRRILAFGALAGTAGLAAGIWLLSQRKPAPAPVQSGRIDVFFTKSDQDDRFYKLDSNSIPLRTGELIRLKASLDPSAFPVLAVLTASDRRVQIAYPLDSRDQKPVSELPIPVPSPEGYWWRPLTPPANGAQQDTLTFVLIAGREPVRDLEMVKQRLSQLGEIPAVGLDSLFVWQNGQPQLVRATPAKSRGIPDVRQAVKAKAGILDKFGEPLPNDLRVVYAVSVPQWSESQPARGE